MKSIVLLLIVLIGLSRAQSNWDLFQNFVRKYEKTYSSIDEMRNRFNVFQNNLEVIERKNREANGLATYGITQFADLTHEEFSTYSCGGPLSRFNISHDKTLLTPMPKPVQASPDSFDWRTRGAVTPVKNQQQCGSCWAFSTVGNIEGAWFLAGHSLTSLSESEFVDCSFSNYGCGGGWPYMAMNDIQTRYNGVVDTEASYPYTPANGQCKISSGVKGATFTTHDVYCTEGNAPCSEGSMKDTLFAKGPLSVCLNADGMEHYNGGIDSPSSCPPQLNHCVLLVGYGSQNGVDYWLIKNSWGLSWGENGYYRLRRGTGACGINTAVSAANI